MSHIFVSYSKKDIRFARHLRRLLEAEGFAVWMDETRLKPGERWWTRIERNIDTCAAFIVIMSPRSRQSEWVEREILYADDPHVDKPIFPVLLEGRGFPMLGNLHYADMRAGLKADLPPFLLEKLRDVVPVDTPDPVPDQLPGSLITDEFPAPEVPEPEPDETPVQTEPEPVRVMPRLRDRSVVTIGAVATVLAIGAIILALSGVLDGGDGEDGDWTPVVETINGLPMVRVPAGCFVMGSHGVQGDEQPAHEACLSEFWIGQTEVTNAQYKACVDDGSCTPPGDRTYYDDPAYADHPVVYVDWEQASMFAAWVGGTLPTEAQWEYAACGPEGWTYPWGNDQPTCERANFLDCEGGTAPVGPDQRTAGASWVGALDMAGNVWEWVADWYNADYYAALDEGVLDPAGPTSGTYRVLRGGSWYDTLTFNFRATFRNWNVPQDGVNHFGFRCARSSGEEPSADVPETPTDLTPTPEPSATPAPAEMFTPTEPPTDTPEPDTPTPEPSATPAPTETFTPTEPPTHTQEPDTEPVKAVNIDGGTVNIRAGPGLEYDVVGSMPVGDSLTVTGISQDGEWYRVDEGGRQGWIYASLVSMSGGPALPIVIPTTPIPAGSDNTDWTPVIEINGLPMVYVPAGCFMMGSDEGDEDERPVHEVCLSEFWIGQTEVTNAQYKACVDDGACTPPRDRTYYDDPAYAEHPVVYVDWEQAGAFVAWAGGSLPTEAQWEYAARGPESGTWTYPYPWGNDWPTCERANLSDCEGGTAPVGPHQRTAGASWVGALDMAGNVWEWVADWYEADYYATLDAGSLNPAGPASGSSRVLRGGAFYSSAIDLLAAVRLDYYPDYKYDDYVGFRCARSVK
ncbi:MAG: SUMF1/EgtB/PvdO family nonheme iron enzyme [Anaerolineae bacterium]|nr:SUMF1/EgtB/PvdO family nonheme iron enzyme [Anaerolineae bacterium]